MSTGYALREESVQAGEPRNQFGPPVGEADRRSMLGIYADFFSVGQNSITFPRC